MYLLECGKKHTINYNESCCLRHLLEMNNHAEMSTLTHKYAKLLLKTLNHHFKIHNLSFANLKLEEAKVFLDIMSKYISHYYFINKFEFSKLLVKIALKACDETLFKEHPELIIRKCAIYNNLSCVYERTGSYTKSIKYLKYYLKYANNNLDKAVVFNNIGKIYLKLKDRSGAIQSMRSCYDFFKDEVKTVTNERFRQSPSLLKENSGDYNQKIQLISFLYYNYANFLVQVNRERDASDIFRKGYEFSISNLGEFNSLVSKFSSKIGSKLIYKSPSPDDKKITIDSKYDSDLDYMSIMDHNFDYKSNRNRRNFSEDKKLKSRTNSRNMVIDKKNTLGSLSGTNFIPQTSFEMLELKTKMDILLQKFDKIDVEKFEKLVANSNTKENQETSNSKYLPPLVKSNTDKKRDSVSDIMKRIIVPGANKFFIKGETGPVGITEDFLKEIMNEVEMEQMSNKSSSSINKPEVKDSNRRSSKDSKSRNRKQSLFLNKTDGNISSLNNSVSASPNAPQKRNLRDLFRKFIPTERLEAIDSISKKPAQKQGLFAELVSSMNDDNDVNINQSYSNKNADKSPNLQTSTTHPPRTLPKNTTSSIASQNTNYKPISVPNTTGVSELKSAPKKSTTLFNAMMEEASDISPTSNQIEKQIQPKEEKPFYGISLALDNVEDNYECETFFIMAGDKRYDTDSSDSEEPTHLKSGQVNKNSITSDAKKIQQVPIINIQKDETIDEYEFTAFYVKNEGQNDNTNRSNESSKSDSRNNVKQQSKLIERVHDYHSFIKEKHFFAGKKKKEVDIKKHFEGLLLNLKEINFTQSPVFSIIRELNGEVYKISISYGKSKEAKGVFLRLYKENSSTHLAENFISFEKLKSLCAKIALHNSLPRNVDINLISSIDLFIEKIFIYHCYILNKDSSVTLGVLTRPLGICFNRAYEFSFLRTSCIIDIFITQAKEVKFFIYNKNNEFISLQFDWSLDAECFNTLFIEYQNNQLPSFDREICIPSYKTIDDAHLAKNGFITDIIINTQKIIKHKIKDENLTFDAAFEIMKEGIYKNNIRDNFKFIDLWSVQFDSGRNAFEIEFYTLKKVQIKNEQIFVNLNKTITFEEVFYFYGLEIKEIAPFISEKEKSHWNYILLNSVNLSDKISEEISRKDVNNQLHIIVEKPMSLFKYSFAGDLDERINSFSGIFTLEYLYYNPANHFYKLTYHDNRIQKSYIKFLSALHFTCLEDSIPSSIASALPTKLGDLQNSDKKKELKSSILRYLVSWKREVGFSLFDSIDSLLNLFGEM